MPWLPFSQNWCFCFSKTFAKCVGIVGEVCCLTLFNVIVLFDFDYSITVI